MAGSRIARLRAAGKRPYAAPVVTLGLIAVLAGCVGTSAGPASRPDSTPTNRTSGAGQGPDTPPVGGAGGAGAGDDIGSGGGINGSGGAGF